jgi:biopolymer transport protein ExbD
MGVAVETGRSRRTGFELNLVPFIDLLSVQITFLLASAVWVQLSSLPLDTGTGEGEPDRPPPVIRLAPGRIDWRAVQATLAADRGAHAETRAVVIEASDGVAYDDFVRALDLARSWGYDRPAVSTP